VDLSRPEPRPESAELHAADGVLGARGAIHYRCDQRPSYTLVTYDIRAGQGHSEGTLWSAGLSLAGVISIPIWIKLYNKWDGQLRSSNAEPKWFWFNLLFVIMAQVATVSFIWTVNLPYHEYPIPHGVTAALYFYLTLLLGTIAILVVRKIDNYPKDIIKMRLALNLAGYACMILLGLSVRALDADVCEAPCKPLFMNAGMDPDHDHIIHYKVAIFEWLMVFTAQIGYFYTFNHDLEDESIID